MRVFHIFVFFTLLIPVGFAKTINKAMFAGGCFWCMEPPYEALKQEGVIKVTSGYTGGAKANPTYEEVSAGKSGHREVVEVQYDPQKISLDRLLEIFWINIDPLDGDGQFCDRGEQYQSAVYFHNSEEKKIIERSKQIVSKKLKVKGKIKTKILPVTAFWPAEDYHQDYYIKNPLRYKFYRHNCGRDKRLDELWSH